jgi:hypothetical protein
MKRIVAIIILGVAIGILCNLNYIHLDADIAHAQNTAQPQDNNYINGLSLTTTGGTFANIGTLPPQTNGTLYYCSDCTQTTTCAGGGAGALAKLVNGTWKCVDVGVAGATSTPFAVNGSPVAGSASPQSYLVIGAGGTPTWAPTIANAATATPFSVNGSPVPGTAAAGLILGIGAGGTPVFTASPAPAALVNGSAIPATAAAGLFLFIGPGGTPTFTATPTAYATPSAATFTSVTDTGLSSGLCVQASTGGLLTTTSGSCGSGVVGQSVVGSLPGGQTKGTRYDVTDCMSCTFGIACVGGGSTFCPEVFNGSTWQAY